ncbi:transcriptional activator srcap-like protein [Apiospora kogelbergensis]|uniref:Transcriptional activator srcap-like protein n=1 Tax=Apiospora kogelbergensis TaxID=1337665 RepID=A0AAW0QTZ7_9PEZI
MWVASFSIDFGVAPGSQENVNLYPFYLLVLPASLREASALTPDQEKAEAPRPLNEGHNFVATSGLMNADEDPRKPKNAPWVVKGGLFCFVAECRMLVSNVQLVRGKDSGGNKTTAPVEFKKPDGFKLPWDP